MKMIFSILACVIAFNFSFSQKKWHSSIEANMIFPNEAEYDYSYESQKSPTINFDVKMALNIEYLIEYQLFKKFSVGAVAGVQSHFKPDITMFKIGGIIKYYFVDENNVYVYLQDAVDIPFNKSKFKSGNDFRIGLGYPILKRETFNLNMNLFYGQNNLDMHGADPILFGNEKPANLIFRRMLGVGFGIKF